MLEEAMPQKAQGLPAFEKEVRSACHDLETRLEATGYLRWEQQQQQQQETESGQRNGGGTDTRGGELSGYMDALESR
ncbi:unnamed protein product, partial [Discosporangium mesarthrocarpum]